MVTTHQIKWRWNRVLPDESWRECVQTSEFCSLSSHSLTYARQSGKFIVHECENDLVADHFQTPIRRREDDTIL